MKTITLELVDPGPSGALQKGDLMAGFVRRPDPVPCSNCAEWDMCRNGQYRRAARPPEIE
jgi:hypothetical protein